MSNYLNTYLRLVMKMKLNQTVYQLRKLGIFKKIIPSDIYGNDVLSFGYSAFFLHFIRNQNIVFKNLVLCSSLWNSSYRSCEDFQRNDSTKYTYNVVLFVCCNRKYDFTIYVRKLR